MLKVRPHTKSGGVVHFRPIYEKCVWGGGGGGQSTSGPIYEKCVCVGGGGGGGQSTSGRYTKSGGGGGGASPLQVRYLCLAHVIVNNKRLQF